MKQPRDANGRFMTGPPFSRQTLESRFWQRVERRGPDECWLWNGAKDSDGYGKVHVSGRKSVRVHRVAYEQSIGPIPEGLQIDHLCRTRLCVNPSHLEAVTSRTNTLRGYGTSAQQARKTHCVRGHPFDLVNTEYQFVGSRARRHCRTCRQERVQRAS